MKLRLEKMQEQHVARFGILQIFGAYPRRKNCVSHTTYIHVESTKGRIGSIFSKFIEAINLRKASKS